ncbi:hypothetical protein CH373_05110 [Leptospira perolatii]|uniref:Alpha/beta hydrolase n=2 Tax=Leptospira perolatii TaxID=2023191 RepID=A0A2M9ZQQ5_9LEPT|nr:hypothetical protein CH360_05530 [Leptospira perolatii]PJZ74289.1 hypothetical protein CH373_05110 [Leptospira perolatii]
MVEDQEGKISIPVNYVSIKGNLTVPKNSNQLVILIEGNDDKFGREPKVNVVALKKRLTSKSVASLVLESLLSEDERSIAFNHLDLTLLSNRLITITNWIRKNPKFSNLKIIYCTTFNGIRPVLLAAKRSFTKVDGIVAISGNYKEIDPKDWQHEFKIPVLVLYGELDSTDQKFPDREFFLKFGHPKSDQVIIKSSSNRFTDSDKWDLALDSICLWLGTL